MHFFSKIEHYFLCANYTPRFLTQKNWNIFPYEYIPVSSCCVSLIFCCYYTTLMKNSLGRKGLFHAILPPDSPYWGKLEWGENWGGRSRGRVVSGAQGRNWNIGHGGLLMSSFPWETETQGQGFGERSASQVITASYMQKIQ